jgi:hypothetical protein
MRPAAYAGYKIKTASPIWGEEGISKEVAKQRTERINSKLNQILTFKAAHAEAIPRTTG